MARQISLKKNFVMNAILTMSSFIFPLITFPYVSRILGPAGIGKVSVATSWATYFNMIAQLGIPTYGVRACAQVRDNKTINLVMGVLSYAVFLSLIFLNPHFADEKPLYLIISSMILFNAIGMEWLYRGLEQYAYITRRSIAFKFVALVAMFLLIHAKKDYVIYGGITIFASSASNVMNFFHSRRYITLKPVGGYHYKKHLKAVGIFFAMAVATTFYTNLDTIMLKFMKTNTEVGYYNASIKIKTILVSIVTSLGTVLLPRASYYVKNNMMDDFRRITKKALDFVILLAAPLALYFILFAREGLLLLSGRAYENAIVPMQWITPTVLLIGMTNILGIQILVPMGREIVVLQSEIVGAVTDFIANLLLIPKWNSAGATAATLAAEAAVFVVQYMALRKSYPRSASS